MEKENLKYKNKILEYVYDYDYDAALEIIKNVDLVKHKRKNYTHTFDFVTSETSYFFSEVPSQITTFNGKIIELFCGCQYFRFYHRCKHIAACMIKYADDIFKEEEYDKNIVSKDLLSIFETFEEKEPTIKKKVELEIELHKNYVYQENVMYDLRFKIGVDKKYVLNKKLLDFSSVFLSQNGTIDFGMNFVYNPDVHFFSPDDENVISYIISKDSKYFNELNESEITKVLFHLAKKKINLYVDGKFKGTYQGITEDSPFVTALSKVQNGYKITFKNLKDLEYVGINPILVFYNGKMSKIDNSLIALINKLYLYKIDTFEINDEDFSIFKNGLLPKIKDEIEIAEDIKDVVIIGKNPKVKLYFDSKSSGIICNIKFLYDGNEVDYFDKSSNVIHDREFENKVVEDIYSYNFKKDSNYFIMDDIDYIGPFIESEMELLAKKYEVYSTEKFKKNKMVKTMVKSSFSIGKDNILSYSFDSNGISDKEINDMINSYKNKKRYYKLKSGEIVNLENDENLKELNSLLDDMDLNKVSSGVIPKYRAIYLASLKDDRYSIIETNNIFDKFIETFNQNKNATIKFSKKDLSILRDYQVTGIKWLYNIYKCELGSVLADEMGLGKSIQFIYLIKQILKENKDAKILIVCPTALVYNWQKEFEKFGKDISYKVLYGHKEKRHNEYMNYEGNVIITSYGVVREDEEYYSKMYFDVMAIDEAQNIKNVLTGITKSVKSVNAKIRFALTGTPLENNVSELWSIFDYIMPGYLTDIKKFNAKYGIKEFNEETNKILTNLKNQIAPFILRRKKTDVLSELPAKIENNIYIDLGEKQKNVYAMEVKKTRVEMEEIIAKEGYEKARFKILQLLTKLRQLCIDPKMVYENYTGESFKITEVIKVCKEVISNGHKILLFSSFKTAIDILNREFTNEGISTYVIDGSVNARKRNELVEKFNNDDTNCFLITIKSGGTGLNLTSADVVIHLDLWWNPQVENQATDRAHRIGQKNTVEVIKLICKGTIEEKILELQNKKKLLSDSLIEGEDRDKNIISLLSEEDIKSLLSIDNEKE